MRTACLYRGLLLVPFCMFGCSQGWNVRKPPANDVKTVASVGDQSLPIRSGTPDSSVRAEDAEPILPAPSRGRLSGRVYDEGGKPVPGARVRLAVGGESGGKAVSAVTDRSGAFTLRGVRPGSSYTVIAEYEGDGGLQSGRIEAEAPDTDVRIGLQSPAVERDGARRTMPGPRSPTSRRFPASRRRTRPRRQALSPAGRIARTSSRLPTRRKPRPRASVANNWPRDCPSLKARPARTRDGPRAGARPVDPHPGKGRGARPGPPRKKPSLIPSRSPSKAARTTRSTRCPRH